MKTALAWHELSQGGRTLPAVLFLHGFMGCGRDWLGIASLLSGAFRCLCPDLPGHGASPAEDSDMAGVAETLVAQLRAEGIGRCAVVGYSMGGRLGLYLAVHYPEVFGSAVLESASPGIREETERSARHARDLALAGELERMAENRQDFGRFLEEWYSQPLFCTLGRDPLALRQLLEQRMACSPAGAAAGLRALSVGGQPSLWEALPDYSTPTLLIVGEEDRKYRVIAESMCEACPRMAVEIFAGCSHNVHFEKMGGYTTLLRRFLHTTT